jgi:3-oxoacyl-[acyl-carrier protein] reductase
MDDGNSTAPVTLITGSNRGIGRHLAEHYLKLGHHVIGCSRKDGWGAENYLHYNLDVTHEKEVVDFFEVIRKKEGRLDNLINNAGVAWMNLALLTPVEAVSETVNTNFLGTFLFCREGARLMVTRKYGRILNIVSTTVPLKIEGDSIYAASKAAVESFTQKKSPPTELR